MQSSYSYINFDNNATTRISQEALFVMNESYKNCGNSSSQHALGRKAAMSVEIARQNLSDALNAENYEIFFTSTGTEANNTALSSLNFSKILYAKFEHNSVYNTRPKGSEFIELQADNNGVIDIADLQKKLSEIKGENFLLSLMLANNESGAIQPVKDVAKIVHQNGGLIHSDIVQAFGKINVDIEDLNIDFASISAHKINGPQGCGALLVRRGIDINPLIFGGGQERGKRSGTHNVVGIAAFGVVAKSVQNKIANLAKIAEIRDFIELELKKIANNDIKFFSQNVARLPNTSFFSVKNADSQTQLIHFDLNKILVSSGSACSSGAAKKSRNVSEDDLNQGFANTVRISLCQDNTMEEAVKFVKIFDEFYSKNLKY